MEETIVKVFRQLFRTSSKERKLAFAEVILEELALEEAAKTLLE